MKTHSLHATCVAIQNKAVLISGKPGSGKSSLALHLIDRGAVLISDDQTFLVEEKGHLIAKAPSTFKGILEVRGVGLCSFPYEERAPFGLWVEICEEKVLERLPMPAFVEYYGIKLPLLKLLKDDPLAAIKVELKLDNKATSYV